MYVYDTDTKCVCIHPIGGVTMCSVTALGRQLLLPERILIFSVIYQINAFKVLY